MTQDPNYRLAEVAPIFAVTDLARARDYCVNALMFEVSFEWADAPDEPIRYAILRQGNCQLHLSESPTAPTSLAYFFVDNVKGYHDAVMARGAELSEPLRDHPWEMREFEAVDPDGNRLVFGEHLSRIAEARPEKDAGAKSS